MKNRILPHVPKEERTALSEGVDQPWIFKRVWGKSPISTIQLTDEEWKEKDRKKREEERKIRKQTVMGILKGDPELLQEVVLELRKKKLEKFK